MCSIKGFLLVCGLYCFYSANCETLPLVATVHYSYTYLYRGHNFTDQNIGLNQPTPALSTVDFDNKAHSITYFGIIVYYENKNYNGDEEGLVIWRNSTALTMEVLPNNGLGGKISSVRPIGVFYPSNWQTPSLSLFHGTNFTGTAANPVLANTAELNFKNATSLIIVGKGVSWTFYDEIDFSGNGRCLTTTELVNYYPNLDAVGFDLRLAASVEQGCWAVHGIAMPESEESGR